MKSKGLLTSIALMAMAVLTSATGCSSDSTDNDNGKTADKWASLVNETRQEAKVSGSTMTYGTHTYTVEASGAVSFSNIPSGYTEFEAVYSALLGKSVEGTAAMIPMAMEIYARNNATGERCIQLLCTPENATTMIRSLQSKFQATSANDNDPYIQRYLPAALLKGATAANAYTPASPYTVEMTASVNKPQAVIGGIDTFLYIIGKGWDTEQRQVEIYLKNGSSLYTVYNCPSVYSQCQTIVGTWGGLK